MSLRALLLNRWLKLTEKPHLKRASLEQVRRSFEAKARILFHAPRGTAFEDRILDHQGHMVPATGIGGVSEGALILYFHGGGYGFGSPRTHRAMVAWLCRYAGLGAVLPRYRLAPEHPFPAAVEDALTAYRSVMNTPGGVILGGDSAGGGLALALLGEITRLGLPQPRGCFCLSPLTDLSLSAQSVHDNRSAEVILPADRAAEMALVYLDGADKADPRASPLHAGFAGACPVWIAVGDTEILLDDTRRMAAQLKDQGVAVTCVIEHDLPHVWPIFRGLLPEADRTLRQLAGWIRRL
ncbi:alpha/beta hydrolase fold domain-containing protein [Roseovarius sp. CAU 1744]|uniref:alpha/beta hydrolase fold domain-containing protein n=1 Tax=Roseovarius sp. CAU 1744 TaxID=3140368 RepID=UPI00325BE6A2